MVVLSWKFVKGYSVITWNKTLIQNLLLKCLKERDFFKSQGKDLLQNLAKKIDLSVYGGNIGKDIKEEYKCVTEN